MVAISSFGLALSSVLYRAFASSSSTLTALATVTQAGTVVESSTHGSSSNQSSSLGGYGSSSGRRRPLSRNERMRSSSAGES